MKKIMLALLLAAISVVTSMASANYPNHGGILSTGNTFEEMELDSLIYLPIVLSGYHPFPCEIVTTIPQIECEALVALYNSTNGDDWTDNSGWLSLNDPCTWYGIACDLIEGHITAIYLIVSDKYYYEGNNLAGSLPPELGNLSSLKSLTLYDNQLTGAIPPELGDLTSLDYLSITNTQLTGSIPPELGNLSHIESLNLSSNQLTGSIPSELDNLSSLDVLYLSHNQLTGSIPPELGNLTSIRYLYLDHNKLSGSIPSELGNLVNLGDLFLDNNQLVGPIPDSIRNITDLSHLYLHDNDPSLCVSTPELLVFIFDLGVYYGPTWICTESSIISQ